MVPKSPLKLIWIWAVPKHSRTLNLRSNLIGLLSTVSLSVLNFKLFLLFFAFAMN